MYSLQKALSLLYLHRYFETFPFFFKRKLLHIITIFINIID